MSVPLETTATIADVVVGLETPLALLALPVAVALAWFVVFRRTRGTASTRSRRLLFVSRVVVVALLVLAAAGPYTVQTKETRGDPRVTLLVDRSDSMAVSPDVDELESNIESEGIPVTVSTIGNGTRSRVGDGIAANLRENGSVVVVSDGRVTDGRSLAEATDLARSLNATISTVSVPATATERYVTVNGPAKTSVGVESTFLASVGGVNTDSETTVTVSVDGEEVASRTLSEGEGSFEFSHEFNETGSHRIVAEVESDDRFAVNDVFRKTVRVVERPKILYVSQGDYPLRSYLERLYDVETAESVPSNLDEYYAVVLQNMPAEEVGDVDALQRFVIDGNGLLTVGGDRSFENGGYNDSSVASMLPVTTGEAGGGSTTLILAIDVSGSAQEGMKVQKGIALDVLSQLGDENRVGVVGFNWRAYSVAEPRNLSEGRADIEDKIRRLESGGATDLAVGLQGAAEMLGDRQGTIILISDGRDRAAESSVVAANLGAEGTRVITVGVGEQTNEATLQRIAEQSGGSFYRADETDRLRLLFGGASRQYEGDSLTVVNPNTFITSGVELTSNPGQANDVSVRPGAEFLVATSEGDPAIASWRYGLGRVATITAYGPDGSLDGLLQRPDSLVVTKSTNYVIGDPERKQTDVAEATDTRVGEPATVTYRGEKRPAVENVSFRAVEEGVYRATVTPTESGFGSVLDASYAANYPREYGGFGPSSELESAVSATNGRTFSPGEAAEIAEFAREEATRVRDVRQDWTWLLLSVALGWFMLEIVVRRLQVYLGRTRHESGLT